MKAFHGDDSIKAKYVMRVRNHEIADEIVKGKYWEGGKGCAVGCTIHSSEHADYETELGIPRIIARLEDGIFENLPNELAKTWPRRFLESIKVGADLSRVWDEMAVWVLRDKKWGVLQFAKTEQTRDAINSVADLYVLKLEGAEVSRKDWIESRTAAYAYAASAAYAYAAAYADVAAYAYAASAASAAYAAASAAAAAYAAAASAKREEWRIAQSEKLIELLSAAQ